MVDLRTLDSQTYRIIALTLVTALIHLFLGVQVGFFLFILNGLGFLALIIALYLLPQLAQWRRYVHWALMAYTAVTIVAYFPLHSDPLSSGVGLVTKVVEVVLLVLLYLQQR